MDNQVITRMSAAIEDAVEMGENINMFMFINDETIMEGNINANRITVENNNINILQGGFDMRFYFEDTEITIEEDEDYGDTYIITKGPLEIALSFYK